MDQALLSNPARAYQGLNHRNQCWQPNAQGRCGFCYLRTTVPMEIQDCARLERRHTDRLQSSSEVTVQPQHYFQKRQLVMVLVLNTWHDQWVIFRAI